MEDLAEGLELGVPLLSGAAVVPLAWSVERELSAEDWAVASLVPKGSKAPPLKELRASHHQVARLIAEGASMTDVSVLTGYTVSRLSILQNDPAFKELVQHYRQHTEELIFDLNGRLKVLAIDTLEILHERVREAPEEVATSELRQVAELALDRVGYGKQSKQVSVSVAMTAEELRELRESVASAPILSRSEYLQAKAESSGVADGAVGGAHEDAQVSAARSPRSGDQVREASGAGGETLPFLPRSKE